MSEPIHQFSSALNPMNRRLTRPSCHSRFDRRGAVLVAVIVAVTISLALFTLWAQSIVRDKVQMANQQLRMQAVRLAEAGIQRARARRNVDPEYVGETWTVAPEELGGNRGAMVRILVSTEPQAAVTHIAVTAEYPVGSIRRAQITKRIEVPTKANGGTPPGEET
jgi:hypothetical protein